MQILMPQLGESVSEGTVDRWLKKVGEAVKKYEPLLEVVTDKVNAEVPSTAAGILQEILVPEGQTVAVGTPIAVVADAEAAAPPAAPASAPPAEAPKAASPAPAEIGSRFSPAVRRLAAEHNLDLSQVHGSGAGGRVTREDVLAFVQGRKPAAAGIAAPPPAAEEEEPSGVLFSARPLRSRTPAPASPAAAATPSAPPAAPSVQPARLPVATEGEGRAGTHRAPMPAAPLGQDEELLPLTAMRRTIAERMAQSKREIPHAWMMTEADVTGLERLRGSVREEFARREGFELTYFPFFVKAAIAAIREFPAVNSRWTDQGVAVRRRINIGIAVGLDDGLIVPVLRGADGLSIAGIARAAREIALRAQAGKLQPDDVQGGTITLNNTGTFGSIASMPIIPPGQAGIITLERVVRRPAVVGEGIAVRAFVNLCCSFDHRVLDGLQIGRFMKRLREAMEAYAPGDSIY